LLLVMEVDKSLPRDSTSGIFLGRGG
jgi:hypothetical protein